MKIHRVINNNIVVILDKRGNERIITGRGIGFRKHGGDEVDEKKIEQEFSLSAVGKVGRLEELLREIPLEVIDAAMQIMEEASRAFEKDLNDSAVISLSDHIYTAIERDKQKIPVKNVLLWETKKFYPEEFRLGKRALEIIKEKTGVMLSEDEAGFIAIHLVNAQLEEGAGDVNGLTKIMQEILNIVKYSARVAFDEESVYYCRFITHLKFFAQRLLTHTTYEGEDSTELLNIVKKQYKQAWESVKKVEEFLVKKYDYPLSEEEKLYLTIHIARIIDKSK